MSYDDDIEIDETALDVEWLNQPRLMLKYARVQAERQRDLDLAKEERDTVRAQLDRAIRENPEKYGVVVGPRGLTEGAVTAAVSMHPDYVKANGAYIDATYEYNVAVGAVRAFDQRRAALENLVRLHGQQYFAGPSVPHDLAEMRRSRDDRVQGKIKVRRRG